MPLSRRRKKRGKKVGNGERKNSLAHDQRLEEADISAGVTLQDLINVLAAQEYQKQKTEQDNEEQKEND